MVASDLKGFNKKESDEWVEAAVAVMFCEILISSILLVVGWKTG